MGSFIGHVVPGTFFLLFSSWWAWSVFHRYFICQREALQAIHRGRPNKQGAFRYKSTSTFPSICCSSTLPTEGILKIVVITIGMIGEFVTGFDEHTFAINNAHHMTMFFFFGINGATDILLYYGFPLPANTDYASSILAFSMEGLLFFYHLHGRSPMDIQVHMLLVYTVATTIVSIAFEMRYRFSVLPVLWRAHLTMLQGSWFYQVGFILYPPSGVEWDQSDHKQMMVVILIFAWHNAAIFFLLLIMGTFIYFRVKTMDRPDIYQYMHPFVNLKISNGPSAKLNSDQTKSIVYESEEEEIC